MVAAVMTLPVSAYAQSGEQQDSVRDDAVDAVTQPLSDLNLRKKDIPLILQIAQNAPYSLEAVATCELLQHEIGRLEEALGPDADSPQEEKGLLNTGLQAGGNILSGFIPFRGVVRQLSGANAERARWEAAIYSGVARRSYLKGYMLGQQCPVSTPQEAAVRSAEDVLGLPPRAAQPASEIATESRLRALDSGYSEDDSDNSDD